MRTGNRSDSFDYIYVDEVEENQEMTRTPISSRANLPPLEPFVPAAHTLRVELGGQGRTFPSIDLTGPMPIHETYIGLAAFNGGLVPCKIVPKFMPRPALLGWGGVEHTMETDQPFFIVLLDAATMEWVPARDGVIPDGRRPVQAGFEHNGEPLYHAVALIDGARVPGKVGEHLGGALVPWGGHEHFRKHYQVLCWRD